MFTPHCRTKPLATSRLTPTSARARGKEGSVALARWAVTKPGARVAVLPRQLPRATTNVTPGQDSVIWSTDGWDGADRVTLMHARFRRR